MTAEQSIKVAGINLFETPCTAYEQGTLFDQLGNLVGHLETTSHAERVAECLNACAQFEDPETEIPELIEGFFEGKGEPSRDESVYYLTVRDTVKKETATLIIADTSEGAAQRLIDCVNACESLPDPAADVAEMIACLSEIDLGYFVQGLKLGDRIEKILSKVEK